VDLLASDLVQLARVRAMREALMRPGAAAAAEGRCRAALAVRRRVEAVRACRAALAGAGAPAADDDAARPAADALADLLAGVVRDEEEDLEAERERAELAREEAARGAAGDAAAADPATAGGAGADAGLDARYRADQDAFERAEAVERRAAAAAVEPIRAALADPRGVLDRLTGRVGLSAADRAAWGRALAHLDRQADALLRQADPDGAAAAYERDVEAHLVRMAGNLPSLELLHRYERPILKGIRRHMAALAGR
jgi:hypothetical protein